MYPFVFALLLQNATIQAFTQGLTRQHRLHFAHPIQQGNLHLLRAEKAAIENDPDTPSPIVSVISLPADEGSFKENAFVLSIASIIGVSAGLNVAVFKTLIELLSNLIYGVPAIEGMVIPPIIQPAIGGLFVGLLVWRYGECEFPRC